DIWAMRSGPPSSSLARVPMMICHIASSVATDRLRVSSTASTSAAAGLRLTYSTPLRPMPSSPISWRVPNPAVLSGRGRVPFCRTRLAPRPHRLAVAAPGDDHRLAGVHPHDLLHVLEPADALAVDLDDDVADLDAAAIGGARRLHLADLGRGEGLTIGGKQDRQYDDGEDEI